MEIKKGCVYCANYFNGKISLYGNDTPSCCSIGYDSEFKKWWDEKGNEVDDKQQEPYLELGDVPFNSDWNLLMMACDKFDSLVIESETEKFFEMSHLLDSAVVLYQINIAFTQLVECVKWYNSLKDKFNIKHLQV